MHRTIPDAFLIFEVLSTRTRLRLAVFILFDVLSIIWLSSPNLLILFRYSVPGHRNSWYYFHTSRNTSVHKRQAAICFDMFTKPAPDIFIVVPIIAQIARTLFCDSVGRINCRQALFWYYIKKCTPTPYLRNVIVFVAVLRYKAHWPTTWLEVSIVTTIFKMQHLFVGHSVNLISVVTYSVKAR